MTEFTDSSPSIESRSLRGRWQQLLDRHHWLPFVLPFAVFTLLAVLEPNPDVADRDWSGAEHAAPADNSTREAEGSSDGGPRTSLFSYPLAYTLRISATLVAVLLVWPRWWGEPRKISWFLSLAVGVVGAVLWIGICRWRVEDRILEAIGQAQWATFGDRPAYNPFDALGAVPVAMVAFITIRMIGLTLIVPLIEEFFLRGFVMRFVQHAQWWTLRIGQVSWLSALVATAYGVLAHPAEPIAAFCWFSLITLLHARTQCIWNCVVAHAVTNGILGIYVLTFRDWTLW